MEKTKMYSKMTTQTVLKHEIRKNLKAQIELELSLKELKADKRGLVKALEIKEHEIINSAEYLEESRKTYRSNMIKEALKPIKSADKEQTYNMSLIEADLSILRKQKEVLLLDLDLI